MKKAVFILLLLFPFSVFAKSLDLFDGVNDKLRDNITPEMQTYNDAIDLYNSGLYEAGINKLYEITCLDGEFCANVNLSLGNFLYKSSIGKNLETRIDILQEAKKEYIESLKIEFSDDVFKNKELVEKEIKELEEELKKRKEEFEKQKGEQKQEQKNDKGKEGDFETETGEKYNEKNKTPLTNDEREALDKRKQDLSLDEKILQRYFNKFYDKNGNRFNPSFYALFGMLPENKFDFFNDTKKDW